VTVTIYDPAPATYDLGQIKALAQARFGACALSEYRPDGIGGAVQIAVYLDGQPNGAKRTAWTSDLAAYTVSHPTAAEQAANQAALMDKAVQALAANATYLALTPPSNSDLAKQVVALTKQVNVLIRQLLGQFDSTAGT
jgi:hypothetical protein